MIISAVSIGGVEIFRPPLSRRPPRRRYSHNGHLLIHRTEDRSIQTIWVLSGPTTEEMVIDARQESYQYVRGRSANPQFTWEWYEPIDQELISYL